MRKLSSMAVIAAIAAAGLLVVPVTTFARGGGGGGGGGFGHVAVHTGFHGGFVAAAHRPGFHHHAPLRHFRNGGFFGWGGCCGVGYPSGGYAPEPAPSPDYADVPAVDFYNTGVYTGGPYGFPLANGSYPPVAHRPGCDAHEQAVPNTHHGLSSVTVVRC